MHMTFVSVFKFLFTRLSLVVILYSPVGVSKQLGLYDQAVYDNIIHLCNSDQTGLEIGLKFVESMKTMRQVYSDLVFDANPDSAKSLYNTNGLSSELHSILNSEGLYQALRNCYIGNENKRDILVLSLIMADTLGKGVGSIQMVIASIFGGRGLLAFLNLISKTLKASRYSYILSHMTTKKAKIMLITATGSLIYVSAIHKIQKSKLKNDDDFSKESSEIGWVLTKIFDQIRLRLKIIDNEYTRETCPLAVDVVTLKKSYLDLFLKAPVKIQNAYKPQKEFIEAVNVTLQNCVSLDSKF